MLPFLNYKADRLFIRFVNTKVPLSWRMNSMILNFKGYIPYYTQKLPEPDERLAVAIYIFSDTELI